LVSKRLEIPNSHKVGPVTLLITEHITNRLRTSSNGSFLHDFYKGTCVIIESNQNAKQSDALSSDLPPAAPDHHLNPFNKKVLKKNENSLTLRATSSIYTILLDFD